MYNPFVSQCSVARHHLRQFQTHTSILNSRAITELEIKKPSRLMDSNYSNKHYYELTENPFYKERTVGPKENTTFKNKIDMIDKNPFLNKTPFNYVNDKSVYQQQKLTEFEKQYYRNIYGQRQQPSKQAERYEPPRKDKQSFRNRSNQVAQYEEQDQRVPQFNYNIYNNTSTNYPKTYNNRTRQNEQQSSRNEYRSDLVRKNITNRKPQNNKYNRQKKDTSDSFIKELDNEVYDRASSFGLEAQDQNRQTYNIDKLINEKHESIEQSKIGQLKFTTSQVKQFGEKNIQNKERIGRSQSQLISEIKPNKFQSFRQKNETRIAKPKQNNEKIPERISYRGVSYQLVDCS